MSSLLRRFRWWVRRKRKEDDLREELQFHLEQEADELRRGGLSHEEAMLAARRDLGNVTLVREDIRRLWTWGVLEQLGQDARFALRQFRRSPAFSAAAIGTLALGIGVNTAIFSVIDAVVLRPLPYRDPAHLVLIDTSPLPLAPGWLTAAWRDRAHTLQAYAGFNGPRAATLTRAGTSQPIISANVTWNFLSLLGVGPELGRDFVVADAARGAPAVGIVSHELWRALGKDPGIVGQTVRVSGSSLTIVGVAAAGFRFPAAGALPATGMPSDTQPDVLRVAGASTPLNVIGRLAPGITPSDSNSELLGILKQEAGTRFPREEVDDWDLHVSPLQDRLVGNVRQRLWLVMGAVGLVLLVACANVTNLLLARASTRQRELALRMALGASRGRLARLVLTESLVLALFGSVIAVAIAYMSTGTARTLLANRIPHVQAITIDPAVLAFNMFISVASGMLCGVVSLPGIRRVSIASIADSNAQAVTGRNRIRRLLLSAETGMTFVLFVGAVLFAQTLRNLSVEDKGFEADRVLTVRVAPGLPSDLDTRDPKAGSKFFAAFFSNLRERLERVPGVTSVGAVSLGPLEGVSAGLAKIAVDERTMSGPDSLTPVAFVTPGYFRAMRIAIVRGRDFNDSDGLSPDGNLVAIVNETFQRRFAPDGDILGARITSGSGPEVFTVVGVARDVPDRSLRTGPEPLLVAPLAQMPGVHIAWGALTFAIRTDGRDPLQLVPGVQRAIWAVNPDIVIAEVASMDQRVSAGMRSERDTALLFGLFALIALMIAGIGVYGVAAYTIAQRTREIGIRVALGAAGSDVWRLVMLQTIWPTVIGISFGVAASAMLTPLVASMMYGLAPLDPAAFGVGAAVLIGVALAATWMPARRATRIDPLPALKAE
jgi:predicted permease